VGKIREGDILEIVIDQNTLEGSVNLIGADGVQFGAQEGAQLLAARSPREDLAPDAELPAESRLWAALQDVSGGTWGGSVFDVDAIIRALNAGRKALGA
jgi:dihydroxyacid dehydratase/phosphogluconate dehydratase